MTQKKAIKIIIADDHVIVRRGLTSLLSLNKNYEVVGDASDGQSAIDLALSKDTDIVLMDISMPKMDGLQATKILKAQAPRIKVLVLSAHDQSEYVQRILECGANGYLLKTTSPDELYAAIDAVMAGNAFFSPTISKILLDKFLDALQPVKGKNIPRQKKKYSGPLSKREQEILQHIVNGKTHHQIADLLHLSIRTIDTHRNNIIKKTNLHDTASLVTYAIKEGIVELPE
jgi:two-component system, NarL family, response regulator NreC